MAEIADPLLSYRFWVEFASDLVAGFQECSGLQAEAEVAEWEEGGENSIVHKFAGRAKYSNITLKHGMTQSPDLWLWFLRVLRGTFERRPITVILLDPAGARARTWSFANAFPVRWTGPEFKADSSAVAVESVEFAHEGLVGL